MARDNGGVIGVPNVPTSTTATGVWSIDSQYQAKVGDTWPQRALFTTKSCRFNRASTDYLNRTPASAGNRTTFTFSFWIKRASYLSNFLRLIEAGANTTNRSFFTLDGDDKLELNHRDGAEDVVNLTTTPLFRDVSAWYHIVLAIDTTQGTASNRVKVYLNGTQITAFDTETYPSLNFDFDFNSTDGHYLGTSVNEVGSFDGYMSEVVMIDGQQLDPTSFGVANSDGVWTPIIYTGTFGTNGFNLQFENAAALGEDSSPNGNTFTVNNLTSIDQSTDYPVVNYATLNVLNSTLTNTVLSEGNLKLVGGRQSANYTYITGTIAASSGKWYWEVKAVDNSEIDQVGVAKMDLAQFSNIDSSGGLYATTYGGKGVQMSNGNKVGDGAQSAYMGGFSANDICMVALDLDNNEITFGRNGLWSNGSGGADQAYGDATAAYTNLTAGAMYVPAQCMRDSGASNPGTMEYNFGNPTFSISSSNADGNGYGNFEYAPPSGYYALNTANLAEFG